MQSGLASDLKGTSSTGLVTELGARGASAVGSAVNAGVSAITKGVSQAYQSVKTDYTSLLLPSYLPTDSAYRYKIKVNRTEDAEPGKDGFYLRSGNSATENNLYFRLKGEEWQVENITVTNDGKRGLSKNGKITSLGIYSSDTTPVPASLILSKGKEYLLMLVVGNKEQNAYGQFNQKHKFKLYPLSEDDISRIKDMKNKKDKENIYKNLLSVAVRTTWVGGNKYIFVSKTTRADDGLSKPTPAPSGPVSEPESEPFDDGDE